jgi:hypothetical protein
VSSPGSTSVRDQANALVSSITSAISQPVLLGFIGSTSCINRHIADRAWTLGRQAHKQYAGITRQPGQRSARDPPIDERPDGARQALGTQTRDGVAHRMRRTERKNRHWGNSRKA